MLLLLPDNGDPDQATNKEHQSQGQESRTTHLVEFFVVALDASQAGDDHPEEEDACSNRHDNDWLVVYVPLASGCVGPDRLAPGADAEGAGCVTGQQLLGLRRLLTPIRALRGNFHGDRIWRGDLRWTKEKKQSRGSGGGWIGCFLFGH